MLTPEEIFVAPIDVFDTLQLVERRAIDIVGFFAG